MIETDDVEVGRAGLTACVDVVLWIYQESIRIGRQISRPSRVGYPPSCAQQHAAALGGSVLTRVSDHGVEHPLVHDHSASMAMAMPMPPPMHNAATP
jgi:hypothetical protein